jgi:hypothetical protein
MKTILAILTFACSFVWAAPSLYVEDTNEYSHYYTRQQAGAALRSFVGCTSQKIGSFVVDDCTVKIKTMEGETELPPESDKEFVCHFEYQGFNPDFYKILISTCQ